MRNSQYVFFQMTEVAVHRKLFAAIPKRIGRLRETADRLDALGMTQRVAQTGPSCDNPRRCSAPITRSVAEKPLGQARRAPRFSP